MSRGAKIALILVLIALVATPASWFILANKRASAARSFLNQGDEALRRENYGAALLAYKKAAILTPKSFAPYYKEGILAKHTGHPQEALAFFERAMKYSGPESAPYVSAGETCFAEGNFAKALEYFKKAAEVSENSSALLLQIARSELNLEKIDAAFETLEKAKEYNGGEKIVYYLSLIKSFTDPGEAIDLIATQLELEKTKEKKENFELSAEILYSAYKKMVKTDNKLTREVIVSQLLNQIGETGLAVKKLERVTEKDPLYRDAWDFLAYGYILQGENDQALSALKEARKLDPTHCFTYYLYGKAYEGKGEIKAARENFEKANNLGFDPENPLI